MVRDSLSSFISRASQSCGRSAAQIINSSSSSRNAVSNSSARTMKRFPSRCASAIHIVRPRESIAETQPQLEPALLRSAILLHTSRFQRKACGDKRERHRNRKATHQRSDAASPRNFSGDSAALHSCRLSKPKVKA
jgi:hypothetical protein